MFINKKLKQQRNVYLSLAKSASEIYFVICDLCKLNNMYRFSLNSFVRIFKKTLNTRMVCVNIYFYSISKISSVLKIILIACFKYFYMSFNSLNFIKIFY